MAYTTRTCYGCGYRAPQPQMNRVTVQTNVGSSSPKVSKRAVVSSVFGSKSGGRQVRNWLSGNSSREYLRNKQVWLCNDCVADYSGRDFFWYVKGTFWVVIGYFILGFFFG